MATTETKQRNDGGTIVVGELRGCALAMFHHSYDGEHSNYLLQLDREPHTYTRSLTPAEVAALARLNPDDGVPEAALLVVCDLTMALASLCGTGAVMTRTDRRTGRECRFVEFGPLTPGEFAELGRVAGGLIASVGTVQR
jgi:hypothetical protein